MAAASLASSAQPGAAALRSGSSRRRSGARPAAARRVVVVRADARVANKQLLEVARTAAAAGAKIVMDAVDLPRNVQYKGTTDLVTDTDTSSEAAILSVIQAAFPGHAVLGEEGGVSGDTNSEYLWCVDPLDGTTNFAHGYPSFSVSVAVLRHTTPVASTVIEFTGGPGSWITRTYTAARNNGAFCNGKPIQVSKQHEIGKSLLCTGFGYEHDECWAKNIELFKHFTDVTQGVRRLGSAAVDMCHVASGMSEAFWEYRLKPWDMAAGVLVAEEAGGTVTTLDGRAFSVFDRSVLVSNGFIHEALLKQTEPATSQLLSQGIDLSQWFVPKGYRVHSGAQLEAPLGAFGRAPGPKSAKGGSRQLSLIILLLAAFLAMHWGWQRRQRAWAGDQLGDSGPDGGRVAVRGLLRGESEQHQRVGGGSGNSSSSGPTLPSSWALAEAEAAWHPPRYSTYTCINAKFDDNFHAATCKFDNVCLNARTLQFEYYVDPELPDTPLVYTQTGVPLAQFSSHMLNLGHAHMDISEAMTWAPTAVRRPFPTVGQGVKWAEVPQALLAVIPAPLTTNFGHVMFDVLVPLFNLQHLFGIYTPEAQPIIMGTSNGSEEELRSTLGRMINTERVDMSLLRLHWQHNAEWLAEYAAAAAPDGGLLCYKNVLAGTGFLNRQMRATDSLPYRQAAMHNIGVVEVPQERPIVTIFNKKGRRMVENSEDVAATLRSRYGDRVEINMFDFGEHPGITMPQQLKLMSDTSILITPCGGIATVLAFMRPGATAIAMNYWHTGHNRSMQMEDNYYQHLEYLDIQYFPVTLEDYAATSDRPECENVKNGTRTQDAHYNLIGALVHCNVRLQAAGLRRMTHYVDNALKRWAARTGRYEVLEPLRQKQAKLTQLAAKQQQAQRQLLQGGGAVVQQRG